MTKKTIRSNIRLEVYPRDAGDFGIARIGGVYRTEQEEYDLAKSIKAQIQRHVDDVGSVNIVSDVDYICEFCKRSWSEDVYGVPECCDRAQNEWLDNHPGQKFYFCKECKEWYPDKIEAESVPCPICKKEMT